MTTRTGDQTMTATLRGPLQRFRIAAYVTGIGLLGLVTVMVMRYAFDAPGPSAIYSPIHGAVYMVYLIITVDLALKARWSVKGAVLVLLAGCVPFVSFVVERWVTRKVKAGKKI